MNHARRGLLAVAIAMLATSVQVQANPLTLDSSPLHRAFDEAGAMPFRCRMAFKEFDKAISEANSTAEAQRAKVGEITKSYLKNAMDKAQAAGDLDKMLAYRKALETADGGIAGDAEEFAKLRTARAAQLEKIDKELVAAGLTAATGLRGVLDWQKKEATKKGDIETAQAIAAFHTHVEAWMDKTKGRERAVSKVPAQAAGTRPKPRQPEREAKPAEPAAKKPAADASPPPARVPGRMLTGTQEDNSVTLSKSEQPHVVSGVYFVPSGKALVVEAGASIAFLKNACIHCEGTLRMTGTEAEQIICQGKTHSTGFWRGIKLHSTDVSLEFVKITGAQIGIECDKDGEMYFSSCVFTRNAIGVKLNGWSRIKFENCLFSDNSETGVLTEGRSGKSSFTRCSIVKNGKNGLWLRSFGGISLDSCLISQNDDVGVYCNRGDCEATVNNSHIARNKRYDIKQGSGMRLDFTGNYWGERTTRFLAHGRDGRNLPNITYERDENMVNLVDTADFLSEPPKECGATVNF